MNKTLRSDILSGFFIIVIFLSVVSCKHKKPDPDTGDYPVWIDMMEQPDMEMTTIRKAFDDYWQTHQHMKGDRSKQFEQWYAMNSRRLDEFGKVITARQVSSEFQRLKLNSGVEMEGEWFNYGPISVGPRSGVKQDGGRVKDIEFHPTDSSTFYVSTFKGGLFRTKDYGTSWKPLTDNLTEEVYVCEVNHNDPNIIYIGTDLGVYKSTDDGINWIPGPVGSETKALLLKEDDQNVVIAGTSAGIYRSVNGGADWTLVQPASKVEDLDSHPANPNILYAATNGSPGEFYRSDDGGASWTKNTTFGLGTFMGVAVTPAAPDNVYLINFSDHQKPDTFEGFYFSEDAGVSFVKQSAHIPCIAGYNEDGSISGTLGGQPNYNLFVVADPINPNLVYAGGIHPWKSEDKGLTWTFLNTDLTTDGGKMHVDQLNWSYSPHDNHIFAVNDGGVYLMLNNGKFKTLTDGLPLAEIYECSQSQTVKSNVAGGTMHCGVKLNYYGEWFTPWGGDEATCIIDPTDENYIYHLKYNKISRSTDGGFHFTRINDDSADQGYYTGTGALDFEDPNTLYVGLSEVVRTKNVRGPTVNWEKISSFGGTEKIQKVKQCLADRNILYVARGNTFHRGENVSLASPAFVNLTGNLPASGQVSDIATHPADPNIVFILLGSRIFRSDNKGDTWTNISGNLPQTALLEMTIDKTDHEGIYVGTDIGVYYKDSTMTSWIDFSKNLPGIRISGMDIYYGKDREDSFITISTDGRGFWRSLLYGVNPKQPVASFTVDKTKVIATEPLNVTNTSPEDPASSFQWIIEGGSPSVSYERNPVVAFNKPGTYKIILEVRNGAGTVQKTTEITVDALTAPNADFSADKTTIVRGGIVSFTDASDNLPQAWEWTFEGGDPANSSEQNPMVNYNTTGTFSVTLKVTNALGTDLIQRTGYITVEENSGSGDLQVHYQFNNNLIDQSSYQRDLVVVGNFNPEFTFDQQGNASQAYLTPGYNSQYLSAGYKGIDGNSKRTVTAWFKTNSSGPVRKTILSWGRNTGGQMFNVMINNQNGISGTIRIEGGSCNVQSVADNLNDDKWHHVAVSFDPADGAQIKYLKIYVDGVLTTNRADGDGSYNSANIAVNTDVTENNIRIGSVQYADYYFPGSIDDVRIYSRILSAREISDIYSLKTSIQQIQPKKKAWMISGDDMIKARLETNDIAFLYLYDTKGSVVKICRLEPGMNRIPAKAGIYIARIKTQDWTETEKVISY